MLKLIAHLLILIVAVSTSLQHPLEVDVTTVSVPEPEPEYKFVFPFFKANWFKAIQYCKHLGLELATVDNAVKESKLFEAVKVSDIYRHEKSKVWVGASDLAEEGEYHWYSTGKPVVYKNWGNRQPDNAGRSEDCLEVVFDDKIYWNDMECKSHNYFVCE